AIAPLENAQVLAEEIVHRIAAQGDERSVGINDGMVRSHGVADDDALGRAVHDGAPGFCRPVFHSCPLINVRNPVSAPEPRYSAGATPARAATPAGCRGPRDSGHRARAVSRGAGPKPARDPPVADPATPPPRRAGCTPAACRTLPTAPAWPGSRRRRMPPPRPPSTGRR